jgi:uncharacterized protein YijF (DUF1287 family)
VFSPLFADPDEWVDKNRHYSNMLRQVVTGKAYGQSQATDLPDWPAQFNDAQLRMLACAQSQVALGVKATRGYHSIEYPWGDVPKRLGTSPDLAIRCLRELGLDLQQLIHVDRVKHPSRYPLHNWANRRPDKSIDHRRLPNIYTFFRKFAESKGELTDSVKKLTEFQPGDLVFWLGQKGGEYPSLVGIVSDRRDAEGVPRIITMASHESWMSDTHGLSDWQVMGHFRVDPDALLERFLEENPGAPLQPRG